MNCHNLFNDDNPTIPNQSSQPYYSSHPCGKLNCRCFSVRLAASLYRARITIVSHRIVWKNYTVGLLLRWACSFLPVQSYVFNSLHKYRLWCHSLPSILLVKVSLRIVQVLPLGSSYWLSTQKFSCPKRRKYRWYTPWPVRNDPKLDIWNHPLFSLPPVSIILMFLPHTNCPCFLFSSPLSDITVTKYYLRISSSEMPMSFRQTIMLITLFDLVWNVVTIFNGLRPYIANRLFLCALKLRAFVQIDAAYNTIDVHTLTISSPWGGLSLVMLAIMPVNTVHLALLSRSRKSGILWKLTDYLPLERYLMYGLDSPHPVPHETWKLPSTYGHWLMEP